jgi:hypothetical protein
MELPYNGDGARTRKTVGGHTTQYVLDLATTLPVVISDTDAVYLYGLDILAQQQSERVYYFHDGPVAGGPSGSPPLREGEVMLPPSVLPPRRGGLRLYCALQRIGKG